MGYTWYGHYNADDSYTITQTDTPRHWYNYYFNDEYISFSSQVGFGEGFAQDALGRRVMLISNRNIFLSEGGAYWSLFGLPVDYGYTDYTCRHGCGHTVVGLTYRGIESRVRMFVPNTGRRELWSVTLTNTGDTPRTVRLVSYGRTELDGVYRPQGYNLGCGGFWAEKNTVYARDYHAFDSVRNRKIWCCMSADVPADGYDSRRNAFIGPYGEEQHPTALQKHGGCTNSDCNSEKLCLALEHCITLAPGERRTVHYQLSVVLDEGEIMPPTAVGVEAEFAAMQEKYKQMLGGVTIQTPWKEFDHLINGWMKYAAAMGSRWARVRHNGYRDMTSDTDCLACVNPELAWVRLKRVLSYQYQSGYAPRTFIDGVIKDRKFSDNTVWMTFAAHTIIQALGQPERLREPVPFNDSDEAVSVYEHLKRSVDFLYGFQGHYGLIRIWGGDWNDCVNYAGLDGKGVSVWLTMAWVRAAKMFARLARMLGKDADAFMAEERAEKMTQRIEQYGFDKQAGYYIYARTDENIIMGAPESEEGQIFLICQLWAVLAGLEHGAQAMDRAEELLETDIGIRLCWPPFTHPWDHIGSMAEKCPGVQDNGGIYLHPSAWKLTVDSVLRRPDRVEEGLRKMLPFDHTYSDKTCGEPYAMFNSYFAPETGYREGTPGQSWRTASSSWLLKSVVEAVFGLQPEQEGLRLVPCLPPAWDDCTITKVFRGCTYVVHYTGAASGTEILSVTVNGEPANALIPPVNGETLHVEVRLGK